MRFKRFYGIALGLLTATSLLFSYSDDIELAGTKTNYSDLVESVVGMLFIGTVVLPAVVSLFRPDDMMQVVVQQIDRDRAVAVVEDVLRMPEAGEPVRQNEEENQEQAEALRLEPERREAEQQARRDEDALLAQQRAEEARLLANQAGQAVSHVLPVANLARGQEPQPNNASGNGDKRLRVKGASPLWCLVAEVLQEEGNKPPSYQKAVIAGQRERRLRGPW